VGTIRDLATHDSDTHETTIANHRNYDSYGNLLSQTDDAVDELFGFTGRLFDEATGLQNNLNRWYDPTVGRWISEDPIGFGGDPSNLYRYVENNPITYVDPTGLKKLETEYQATGDSVPPPIPCVCSGKGIKWRGSFNITGGVTFFGSARSDFNFNGVDDTMCTYIVHGKGLGVSYGLAGGTYLLSFGLGADGTSADVWPIYYGDNVSGYALGAGGTAGIPLSLNDANGEAGIFDVAGGFGINENLGGINVFVGLIGASTKVKEIHYTVGVPPGH
jgi:RHS repeat-associated protein